jgi:hypothetical protein
MMPIVQRMAIPATKSMMRRMTLLAQHDDSVTVAVAGTQVQAAHLGTAFMLQQQGGVLTQRRTHRMSLERYPGYPVSVASGQSPHRRAKLLSHSPLQGDRLR